MCRKDLSGKQLSMEKLRRMAFLFAGMLLIVSACGEQDPNAEDPNEGTVQEYVPNEKEVAYEEYISWVDNNDSLGVGNSLFYSKGDDKFTEVEFTVNDKQEMVKMVEYYTQESQTIAKNIFYLKDGRKFATKELFEQYDNGNLSFVERVSYYDEKEKPIITKQRVAPFEQDLEFESFTTAKKQDCSMARALSILNQEGEFNTTFQGFVKESGFIYLIVGGVGDDAYTSSLIVQYEDPTIKKLMIDEKEMIGTPLIVDFQVVEDAGEGFEYQILRSVAFR